MKRIFIINPENAEAITYLVETEDDYITSVKDVTGEKINYNVKDKFKERYFQIDPWYWFSGVEI
jgi:hypothetical protein